MNPNSAEQRVRSLPVKLLALFVAAAVLTVWLLYTPAGILGKADAVGYAVCHRIDLRSFHLGDRQLPVCVRCSGMFLGALLGLLYQAWIAPRHGNFPPRAVWAALALMFLSFALDGVNSYVHLFPGIQGVYEPQHSLRLLTGSGMGNTLSMVLYPGVQQTVWRNWIPAPAISGLSSLAVLLALTLGMDALVWLQSPVVLYPAALLSAAGVATLLTMVYTMVAVMILGQENRSLHLSDLTTPALLGLAIAFLQIGAIDFVRYLFTGSWDGFHFG